MKRLKFSVILSKKTNRMRTCPWVNFAVPFDYWVKIKESERIEKYLDLARELKKQWNMRVTEIAVVVSVLGTVAKGLERD